MNLSTDCVERAGPEVSWVGREVVGWKAWQSCLDQIKWQQGAHKSQRGREAKATAGEDDSAVLVRRSEAVRPGDGRNLIGRYLGKGLPKGSLVLSDPGKGVAGEGKIEPAGFGRGCL